ncbi:hypothetical protein [Plantibacter sp. YIM 135347]|uniref:hypothetical protein n=1 Tax=Plantibacter sp. YIM 135347 TaxID=3423919 RepID=UPI003D3397A2
MPSPLTLVAPVLAGATRVALGVLWMNEGLLKFRAGFGGADILLVANSAESNSRVPEYFTAFARFAIQGAPGLFGFAMPILELGLGIALVLGALTLPSALMSVLTLTLYWSADQLIGEYPVMVVLSAIVIAVPIAASRFSVTTLVELLRRGRRPGVPCIPTPLRRWL